MDFRSFSSDSSRSDDRKNINTREEARLSDKDKESSREQSSGTSFTVEHEGNIPPLAYGFAKWIILRTVGAIYFFAFLGAWYQNIGLMGQYGLMPAQEHWETRIQRQYSSPWNGFMNHPSIFWWIPLNDSSLLSVYGCGVLVSSLSLFLSINSWLLQLILWLLYFSVVTSAEGTTFYAYGWESQLLETGFLTIFLCALPHVNRGRLNCCFWEPIGSRRRGQEDEEHVAPSYWILWLFRWLCFRINIGAGLIKIRGSSCWAEKTCLYYHFETQPIPSPLSFVYHFLPRYVQSRMVDIDLVVQLYTSFFVLLPTWIPFSWLWTTFSRWVVRIGGFVQSGFMVGIILSGNFAFLNHLTIVPALACLDDDCWPAFLVRWSQSSNPADGQPRRRVLLRNVLDAILLFYICYLSSPVVSNLLQLDGKHQVMNASFDPFRLVNTYGAFGSVGERRYEPIVMISDDGEYWIELEFPCKPGNVTRRPCFCAPYHYRVDWNIWFLGFKPHRMYLERREFWLYKLLERLLEGGRTSQNKPRPWLNLLEGSSANMLLTKYYQNGHAPRFAKVEMYHYHMAGSLSNILYREWEEGGATWWNRRFEETLIPPVRLMNGKLGYASIDEEGAS